jgi:hypothetical protein
MPEFAELYGEAGVDPLHHFMVAGFGASNFVRLRDAKSLDLRFETSRLDVRQVTKSNVVQFSNAMYKQITDWNVRMSADPTEMKWQGVDYGNKDYVPNDNIGRPATMVYSDPVVGYLSAVRAAVSLGAHSTLLFVTGRERGLQTLSAVDGRASADLQVAVLPPQSFALSFKFLQYLDGSNTMTSATPYRPSDAALFVNRLNWIYGPQANISFGLIDADWVKINQALGTPLDSKTFKSSVIGQRNQNADLTVFFVGKYVGNDGSAAGECFGPEATAVVGDATKLPVAAYEDPFLVTLAHEVAHFLTYDRGLGMFHHARPNVLLSTGIESTRLDKPLVIQLNSP